MNRETQKIYKAIETSKNGIEPINYGELDDLTRF